MVALSGRFRAKWSSEIHEEWKASLLRNRADLTRAQLDRTSQLMDEALPDASVENYEDLIEAIALPDENDRHVLAAAIRCGAALIVTFNLKDFPGDVLARYGIEAVHPDDFVDDLFDLDAPVVIEAARRQRARLCNPAMDADDYLDMLRRQGLVQTAKALSDFRMLL